MIRPGLIGDAEGRTQERASDLGHQFFEGVGVIAKPLSEFARQTVRCSAPMNLMPISA
jgi:hypothetical protein